MEKGVIFEELGEKERVLLLRTFGFDVDTEGNILDQENRKIRSKENPKVFLKAKFAALVPGSLKIIDGTPTSISEFLEEKERSNECSN